MLSIGCNIFDAGVFEFTKLRESKNHPSEHIYSKINQQNAGKISYYKFSRLISEHFQQVYHYHLRIRELE
jgi:hypothetical protein